MKSFFKNIKYLINHFFLISRIERTFLIQGFLLCYIFYFITKIFPLKFYLPLIQNKPEPINFSNEERINKIKLVRKTLRRVNRYSLIKFNCLTKAVVFKILLNKLGIESNIAFGVKKIDNKLLAHASVRVDNKTVFLKNYNYKDIYSI